MLWAVKSGIEIFEIQNGEITRLATAAAEG